MEQAPTGARPDTAAASVADLVKLLNLTVEPNCCPLSAPLALSLRFQLSADVRGAFWVLCYEADIASKRHRIPLLTTQPRDLAAGTHVLQEAAPAIPTEGVKEKHLLQVGMLKLALHSASAGGDAGEPLVSINMVTQVCKDEGGVLRRNVISPLEE